MNLKSINQAVAAARNIQQDADRILAQPIDLKPAATEIPLDRIRTDGGTQMRAQLDDATVQEYRDIMLAAGFDPFPPVVCAYDGSTYWLADGFHRVAAARLVFIFDRKIPVLVLPGDRRDAILLAARANSDHGLHRTNADKRRSVETLLRDDQWTQWSDQEIARRCAVDPKTVGNIRRDLTGTLEIPESTTRTAADGRQINVVPIGEKLPLASAYVLRALVLAWAETQPGSLIATRERLALMAEEGESHPVYPILVTCIDADVAAGKPYNTGPHRWRKADLIKALGQAVEELDAEIGETKVTGHQLPSGKWYARNYGRPVKATDLYPTRDQALAAAVAGDMNHSRWWHYNNLEDVLDTDKAASWAVTGIIEKALGDDLNELTIGLRRRVADWPDDAIAAQRLAAVEARIAELTATVRLVAPETVASTPARLPLTQPLPPPLLPGADPKLVARRAKLLHLRELYTQARNSLNEYGDATGHFIDTLPVDRALVEMLVVIDRNLNPAEERIPER